MDDGLGFSVPRERNDCTVRALAATTHLTYVEAYQALAAAGRRPNGRIRPSRWQAVFGTVGYTLTGMIDQGIDGKTILSVQRQLSMRPGKYLVLVSGHVLAIVNGLVHDWAAGRRHRVLAVWQVRKQEATA